MKPDDELAAVALAKQALEDRVAGRLGQAREKIVAALPVLRRSVSASPDDANSLSDLSAYLSWAVGCLAACGAIEEARAVLQEQAELRERVMLMPGDRLRATHAMAYSLQCLGDAERDAGRVEEAIGRYERLVRVARGLAIDEGDSSEALDRLAGGLWSIVNIEIERLPLERVLEHCVELEDVVWRLRRLVGCTPTSLRLTAGSLATRGEVERRLGHLEQAEVSFRKAFDECMALRQVEPDTPNLIHNLALLSAKIARMQTESGRTRDAIDSCVVALDLLRWRSDRDAGAQGGSLVLCEVLQNLGDAQRQAGQPAKSKQTFRELHAASARGVAAGESMESLTFLSSSLQRVAEDESDDGHIANAYELHRQFQKVALRMRELSGDSMSALSGSMFSHKFMGDIELKRGLFSEARKNFEEQDRLAGRLLELCGPTAETIGWRAESLERLGDVEMVCGRFQAAHGYYAQEAELIDRLTAISGRSPEVLSRLAYKSLRFGDLVSRQGDQVDLEVAWRHYMAMFDTCAELLKATDDAPVPLRAMFVCRTRLADLQLRQGSPEFARPHFLAALDLATKIKGIRPDSMDSVRDLGNVLNGLGRVEHDSGDVAAARRYYLQHLELVSSLIERTSESPELLRDLSVALGNLSRVHMAHNEIRSAVDLARRSVGYLSRVNGQLATWVDDAVSWADTLSSWSRLGVVPIETVAPLFRQLWGGLAAYCDLNQVEVLNRSRADLKAFLTMWLNLAVEQAPALVPEVLAASQGRKLMSWVVERLENEHLTQSEGVDQLVVQYRDLRKRLRFLSLGLASEGLDGKGHVGGPAVAAAGPSPQRASNEAQEARCTVANEYEATLRQYEQCRADLAKVAAFAPLRIPSIDADSLAAGLSSGACLLILLQLSNDPAGMADEVADRGGDPMPEQGSDFEQTWPTYATGGRSFAMVLRGDGRLPRIVLVPGLDRVARAMRDLGRDESAAAGNRYAATRDAGLSERYDEAVQAPELGQALWAPLAEHLQGVQTLHVVTHGELHLLALHDGAPDGLQVCHYPGLVFYWLAQRKGAGNAPAKVDLGQPTIALQSHSPAEGQELPPIPFVHAEVQALQRLWGPEQTTLQLDGDVQVDVLHLAGHGQSGQGEDAGVLIGPGQILGLHGLLRSGLRGEIAYLSACVVGKVEEDQDGDPLGTVVALFLRDFRQVVAATVPLSDAYSPLLAILFHAALKAQLPGRLDSHRALRQAKAQLRGEQDWPDRVVQAVRQTYAPVMQQFIEKAQRDPALARDAVFELMDKWLVPACDIGLVYEGPVELALNEGAQPGAQAAVEMLLDKRARLHLQPGVQNLLRYVSVYGAPTVVA